MTAICQTCPETVCTELRAEQLKLDRFSIDAAAADQVYSDNPVPPPGYRNASDDDLKAMGLKRSFIDRPIDPTTDKPSDFRAAVFINDQTGDRLVAFRGSTLSGEDWRTNAQQA